MVVLRSLTAAAAAILSLSSFATASPKPKKPYFYNGFDLSSLKIQEDGGFVFKDTARNNATRPVEDILGDAGMNTVRLRLWVNPTVPYDGGYYETYDLEYTLGLAKRFSAKGYKIYLDYRTCHQDIIFHVHANRIPDFSDYWADPQKQAQPIAWPTALKPLASSLRHYVSSTMQTFSDAGVDLALVSLGNEIRNGMIWPLGRVSVDLEPQRARTANFTGLATLYAAAREGVRDAVAKGVHSPEVMIHIDNGYNLTTQQKWFGSLTATGLVKEKDWDVIGLSFYPFYGTGATLKNLKDTMTWLAKKYSKPIHVVETDWPAICDGEDAPALSEPSIPASVKGQLEWGREVLKVVKGLPKGLGRGIK